jgi:hypothetical protein
MIKSSLEHEQVKDHFEDEVMHVDVELASLPNVEKNNCTETRQIEDSKSPKQVLAPSLGFKSFS